MKMELKRVILGPKATIGVLRCDGVHECFILEDAYRGDDPAKKIPRLTAIPCGTYTVRITHSPRFGVDMPILEDVPGFSGVRIHAGNTPEDTEGCLLPGRFASDLHVGESRLAYERLFAKLRLAESRGEVNTIRITE